MAARSKEHMKSIHQLITAKGRYPKGFTYDANKEVLKSIYERTLDSFYFRIMNLSKDCRQWLLAASNFKAAGDMIGYQSCMSNYQHYQERKIYLTNKISII